MGKKKNQHHDIDEHLRKALSKLIAAEKKFGKSESRTLKIAKLRRRLAHERLARDRRLPTS